MLNKFAKRGGKNPLSIAPHQSWGGNDGPWSPFFIGFGSPAQFLQVLASTSNWQLYVVLPEGCTISDASDCQSTRGEVFHYNESSTWTTVGDFTLGSETNLGFNDAGRFGLDNVTMGLPGSGAPPSIEGQVVVGILTENFFLGSLGLRPAPTNFSNFDHPIPSLLQSLKALQYIPSLSWGYTAGSYQIGQLNKAGYGSLVLGGYDTAKFEANDVTFQFAEDTSRDLVVAINSISSIDLDGSSQTVLDEPILAFLDSTVSHIWLPESACDRLASIFNLTYDQNTDLYLVNNTIHQALVARNASISFTLSNSLTSGPASPSLTIDLPYSAFDLQLTDDYPNNTNNATFYFPIRRAANSSQYTLGRTFFQHAYVIADYERSLFSIHQASFSDSSPELQPIYPPGSDNVGNAGSDGRITTNAIIGTVVGVFAAIMIVLAGTCLWKLRRTRSRTRRSKLVREAPAKTELDSWEVAAKITAELHASDQPMPELSSKPVHTFYELPGEEIAKEAPANGDFPAGEKT